MVENKLQGEFILKKDINPPPQPTEEETHSNSEIKHDTMTLPKGVKPHTKPHFYSAFSYYPEGVTIQDQEEDEEVILLIRRHFITNVPWILGFFLLSLFPPLFFTFSPFFLTIPISPDLLLLTVIFYYLVLFSFTILYFTIWYFNAGIITNKRLIDIDVHNILVRILSEARLNAIQDISVTQVGGIRSIFNYGDVDVQTEGLKQNLEYYRVPQPNFIRTVIGNLVLNRI